jgi:hypothetical protein
MYLYICPIINKQKKQIMKLTFIETTDEQQINWDMQDCCKSEKEIEKLVKRLETEIQFYNSRAETIHKLTNKYKLPIYKLTLKKQ